MDPIVCDSCGQEFSPRPFETRVKGGVQLRFSCPGCHRIYDVAFITTAGVKLRREVERARARGDLDEHRRLLEEYQAEVTTAAG